MKQFSRLNSASGIVLRVVSLVGLLTVFVAESAQANFPTGSGQAVDQSYQFNGGGAAGCLDTMGMITPSNSNTTTVDIDNSSGDGHVSINLENRIEINANLVGGVGTSGSVNFFDAMGTLIDSIPLPMPSDIVVVPGSVIL